MFTEHPRESLNAVPHHTFQTSERWCRDNLEAAIYNLPQEKYDLLVGASVAKCCHLESAVASRVVQSHSFLPDRDSSSHEGLLFETISEH